jgi:hypothetical protein
MNESVAQTPVRKRRYNTAVSSQKIDRTNVMTLKASFFGTATTNRESTGFQTQKVEES